jgi:hypothetical protein
MFMPEDASSPAMRRHYLWVVIIEILVLAGLWALGAAFR